MSHFSAYIGRFAPSPTGALHAGSLVAAMASLLDARAHQGKWLLRIEDLDTPRVVPDSDRQIMAQLTALGMAWDGEVVYQSTRDAAYQAAFDQLVAQGHIYGCACTRKEIADSLISSRGALPVGELPYPGTCRHGLPPGRSARAWRLRVPDGMCCFTDRCVGEQCQDVQKEVGDFVSTACGPTSLPSSSTMGGKASPTWCAAPICWDRPPASGYYRSCLACPCRR